ncbi:PAS sensor protein [Halobacteriales archaeon SW_10_68_16]|jgi:PAS domain S-box-containing protein|nr:MAG: PAS sensor protein [Halobacteriales archaeon SW_10_68_16]
MDSTEHRERIYAIFGELDRSVEDRAASALEVGVEYLGLSVGFLTRIDGGTQEIVQSTGQHPLIQPGASCPLEEAYCRRTVELDGVLAVQAAVESDDISEIAIERFDLGTYIGAKVVVDDDTYGTVCFADQTTRTESFSEAEQFFVELIARLVGQAFERRDYERELAEREAQLDERREIYRAIIDASFDLVFRVGADGRFTYISPAIEELLGSGPDTMEGKRFTAMLPDEETLELAEELYGRVMAGETVEEAFFPLEDSAGDRVFVDLRVTPIYDASVPPADRTAADIVGAQGMARDATERYRRQLLIRVLNRVLRHNLRNDMNVISGFAETLQDRLDGEDAEMARRIVAKSEALVKLGETARKLEENLDDPADVAPADIVPVVRRAATQIDERYLDASVTVDAPGQAIARSAPRLEAAVWELLDNAAKHGGESPSVAVDVTVADRVVVGVTDDGPGLPEQERAVLVADEETPLVHGSGLGLWLVHWIVESVDGTLGIEETASGTRIEISLRADTRSEHAEPE